MKRESPNHAPRRLRKLLPGVGLLGATLLLSGACTGAFGVEDDPTVQLAEAIGEATHAADMPLGLEVIDGPLAGPTPWQPEASHCDASPDVTQAEVCGRTFPASVTLEWSDCQPPRHAGPRPPPPDGGMPPPPGAGMPPPPPHGTDSGARHPPMLSSGTVRLLSTLTPVAECAEGAPLRLEQQATYDIRRTGPEGRGLRVSGTSSASSTHVPGAAVHTRTSTFDTTHAFTDAEGQVERTLHLAGTLEVTFERSTDAPRHVSSGTLTTESSEKGSAVVTLSEVARVPPHVCAWPLSGTLQRTTPDGATHVLTFGPECGQATLDGEAVTLPERPRRGPGGRGPGGRPPPGSRG